MVPNSQQNLLSLTHTNHLLRSFVIVLLLFSSNCFSPVDALKLDLAKLKSGLQALHIGRDAVKAINNSITSVSKNCSRTCKSDCSVPFVLRYGKYCGLLYTGCPGEKPCDGLDACCMVHDACVDKKGYLSKECNQNLLNCVKKFKKSGGQNQTFKGNKCNVKKVIRDISLVMKVALLASGSLPDRHYVHI